MNQYTGTREAFTCALLELADENQEIRLVSADSLKAMRAVPFAEKHPDKVIEVGIGEQCAVNVAAGLATCELIPFVAYPQLNVKFVGINAGLIGGEREGVTHQFYEDIGIVSAILNISIFTPADANQMYHAVKVATKIDGSVYIRAGSGREPEVFDRSTEFSLEGFTVMHQTGKDIVLLSSGFVLNRVLLAAKILEETGILVTVVDINMVKKKNLDKLLALLEECKCVITVEDHNIHGGMGAWIAGILSENFPKIMKRIGLDDTFGESGPADELADAYGLSPNNIAKEAEKLYRRLSV